MASNKCCVCDSECTSIGGVTWYKNWKEPERQFLRRHHNKELEPESRICRRHQVEASRHLTDPCYIPKWSNVHVKPILYSTCTFNRCSTNSLQEKLIIPVHPLSMSQD